MMNIIDVSVGAILGQVIASLIKVSKSALVQYRHKKIIHLQKIAMNTPHNTEWLLSYYKLNNRESDLYDCRIGKYEIKIPFLTKKEWCFFQKIDLNNGSDNPLIIFSDANNNFPISHAIINRRKESGNVILSDSPCIYLDRVETDGKQNKISFHVKPCTYYQVFSNMVQLENETFNAIKVNRYTNTPCRDNYISSVSQAELLKIKPFGLGCAVLLALQTKDGYELLIHERADNIATYPKAIAVIPNFGMEPISGHQFQTLRHNELLLNNFLREYVEEIFNYEDLVTQAASKKINPFWFYENIEEARIMLDAIRNDTLHFVFLGFGFDCLNGVPIVSFLGLVNDQKAINSIKENSEANWEGKSIDLIDTSRNYYLLEKWLQEQKYHPGAAFTISRAQSYLEGSIRGVN